MSRIATILGPADHGRKMTLEDFDQAEPAEGYSYELGRGVINVVNIPNRKHLAQVNEIKQRLYSYRAAHPGQIHTIAGGSDCKIIIEGTSSERHPDIAVYTSAPADDADWSTWIPELLIEVVSPGSEKRDYEEKRDEYLTFGVLEYLIFDAARETVTAMTRENNRWQMRVLAPADMFQSAILPGLELPLAPIFAAARAAGD